MAVKTFTTGEVLTSTDTNTYLTNAGMVYIKSQTVGSGVSSIPVTGAFSSDYDNYRILYTGGTGTNDVNIKLTMGGITTGYYSSLVYGSFTGTTVTNVGVNNGAEWTHAGGCYTGAANVDVTLYAPYLSLATNGFAVVRYSNVWGTATLLNTNATSATAFTLTPSAGTLTGGTVTVYGFRKA